MYEACKLVRQFLYLKFTICFRRNFFDSLLFQVKAATQPMQSVEPIPCLVGVMGWCWKYL